MKVARQATELNLLRSKYQARKDQNMNRKTALLSAGKDATHPDVKEAQAGIDENQQILAEINQCYEAIDLDATQITGKLLHQMGYDDWVRLSSKDLKRPYGDTDKIAYENFVQGYLYYFEQNVNQGDPDLDKEYTLYFDWGQTRTDSALVIYIKPALDDMLYDDYKDQRRVVPEGSLLLNGKQRSPFPPPPSMTDPVKPPPPPPPTQQ